MGTVAVLTCSLSSLTFLLLVLQYSRMNRIFENLRADQTSAVVSGADIIGAYNVERATFQIIPDPDVASPTFSIKLQAANIIPDDDVTLNGETVAQTWADIGTFDESDLRLITFAITINTNYRISRVGGGTELVVLLR